MTIDVECPHCFKIYRCKDTLLGKRFRCKQCEEIVTVAQADEEDVLDDWEEEEEEFAPISRKKQRRKRSRGSSSDTGKISAAAMMSLAGFMVLFAIYNCIVVSGKGPDPDTLPPAGPARDAFISSFYAATIGVSVVIAIYYVIIIKGAISLFQRTSKGWSTAACVMCCIPVCSPLIVMGIPFGITGLIAVNQLDEAGRFET